MKTDFKKNILNVRTITYNYTEVQSCKKRGPACRQRGCETCGQVHHALYVAAAEDAWEQKDFAMAANWWTLALQTDAAPTEAISMAAEATYLAGRYGEAGRQFSLLVSLHQHSRSCPGAYLRLG